MHERGSAADTTCLRNDFSRPGYRVLLEEVRRSAGLDTLTKSEREAIHNVLRTHDEHLKESRHWSKSKGISL